MKTLLIALIVVGLVALHLHSDAKRFVLKEGKKGKVDYQLPRKLAEVNANDDDSTRDVITKESCIYGTPTDSSPTGDANHGTTTNNMAADKDGEDGKN
ncbi:hypothetical protein L1049_021337 [Liquidambar formosana]|uniref:Uncharacterized protein n=1 Tax=Liquidambar formosana TaxID=63359 RepID=A0AAP0SEB8_LIQFO